MVFRPIKFIKEKVTKWLMHEPKPEHFPLTDFERVKYELRPCDVILAEGRSRVSEVIKLITQSPWSHAFLYVGKMHDIENPMLRERVQQHYKGSSDEPLIIESIMGKGTVIVPLSQYEPDHLRICRPKNISRQDAQQVIAFAIGRLGMEYGIRHNLDLFRFLMPWNILPRRWRSSLFTQAMGKPTEDICSSMLAEAFASVKFPIIPIVKPNKTHGLKIYKRNPKLFVPSDFDYSPYFEIIKYPMFELSEHTVYRKMPWSEDQVVNSQDDVVDQDPSPELEPALLLQPEFPELVELEQEILSPKELAKESKASRNDR